MLSTVVHLLRPAVPVCCDVPAGHAPSVQQWGLICLAGLAILYMMMRSGRKRKPDPLDRTPTQASLAQQRSVERQMQNLLVELSQMAQQITAQLDTRSTKLAHMIDDADEKAARLQKLLDECRATLDAAATARPTTPPEPPPPVPAQPAHPDANGSAPFEPSIALVNESAERYRQVYALADAGSSPSDIARQIDRPRGEVELILALRPR